MSDSTTQSYDVLDFTKTVHDWFGLTYANYLVLPRSLLQSMPMEWQRRFVDCLDELAEMCDTHDVHQAPTYHVRAAGLDGRYIRDPVPHYRRGRTRVFDDDLDS